MQKSICIIVFSMIFMTTCAYSDKIAITEGGRSVRLRDSGAWEYISGGKEKAEFIRIDDRLRQDLRPFIDNRDDAFSKDFGIPVNWGHPSYDVKYKGVMKGLHRVSKTRDANKFYRELNKTFGQRAADNILWMIENWELWED